MFFIVNGVLENYLQTHQLIYGSSPPFSLQVSRKKYDSLYVLLKILGTWEIEVKYEKYFEFYLKHSININWFKLSRKGYLSKSEKLSIIIDFSMFKLGVLPYFTLNKQSWLFGPYLPQKRYFQPKKEIVNILIDFRFFERA